MKYRIHAQKSPVIRQFAALAAGLIIALAPFGVTARANAADLTVKAGTLGITSLSYGGSEMLSNGDVHVEKAVLTDGNGVSTEGSTVPSSVARDPGSNKIKEVFPWGAVSAAYVVKDNRLEITIGVQNTSSATLSAIYIQAMELAFPQAPAGWVKDYTYLGANRGDPTVEYANYGSGALAVCDDDVDKVLIVGFPGRSSLTVRPIWVATSNIPGNLSPYLDPYIKRPIAPHGYDIFHLSVRFGASTANELDLAGDLYRKLAATYPSQLHWTDRRGIGTLHLAASETEFHSATNPRGWFADKTIDVVTPAGIQAFHDRILKYADDSIAELKMMNAQGMITWDVEGEEFPQATTYIGDPRLTEELAPEMDSIADAYFKKFRNAGLKTGVCIRPQQLLYSPGKASQEEVTGGPTKVADLLYTKMDYAYKRWGCTLFYVDSNGDPNVPYDPEVFKELSDRLAAGKIPALVMPEHRNLRYFAYTAPYTELKHNVTGTPAKVRAAYPQAFIADYIPDREIGADRGALVDAVRHGDVLLFRAWWADPVNADVKNMYRDAGK